MTRKLSDDIASKFAEMFVRELEAQDMMTQSELDQSISREWSWRLQHKAYLEDQFCKYGIDGGPSPSIVCRDPFVPVLDVR